ncbi:hypothetical protein [Bradyrhizobium sp. JR3.5]
MNEPARDTSACLARGEAAGKGGHYRDNVARADIVTQKDAGITRQEMHEDTKSATPKPVTPGLVGRSKAGKDPTKVDVRKLGSRWRAPGVALTFYVSGELRGKPLGNVTYVTPGPSRLTETIPAVDFSEDTMEHEFCKERARTVRALAEEADPFIKLRLLQLAAHYERRFVQSEAPISGRSPRSQIPPPPRDHE